MGDHLVGVKHRSRESARWGALGALVLVLVAVAFARRITTQGTPALVMHRTLAADVRVPGSAPVLAWPREGEAAVEVEGVGSFGSTGGSQPVPIASVAKVMTAYLTLREHPLAPGAQGFVMTITLADVEEQGERAELGESNVPVRVGERITERQALQALLLPSANNIAAVLAVHEAGSLSAFVKRMSSTASKLGMSSTTYTDPSGFKQGTVSTAADQLKLARVAMRVPAFAAIVDERSAVVPVAGRVANYNGLVGTDGYVGVKTGSDSAAGGCLVFAKHVTIAGRDLTVLGVVLGQREGSLVEAALSSAQRLGDSAAAALRVETILPAGTSALTASNVNGGRTTAVTARALQEVGWAGITFPIQVLPSASVTRLRTGEQAATVAVRGAQTVTTRALATRPLGGPSLGWRLRHLL
jgi:D-alanyl-D-alanine carboxypeptidase (penicillin-binding protein 5/6)